MKRRSKFTPVFEAMGALKRGEWFIVPGTEGMTDGPQVRAALAAVARHEAARLDLGGHLQEAMGQRESTLVWGVLEAEAGGGVVVWKRSKHVAEKPVEVARGTERREQAARVVERPATVRHAPPASAAGADHGPGGGRGIDQAEQGDAGVADAGGDDLQRGSVGERLGGVDGTERTVGTNETLPLPRRLRRWVEMDLPAATDVTATPFRFEKLQRTEPPRPELMSVEMIERSAEGIVPASVEVAAKAVLGKAQRINRGVGGGAA